MNIKYIFYGLLPITLFLALNFAYQSTKVGTDFNQDYLASLSHINGNSIYGEDVILLSKKIFGESSKYDNFHPPFVAILFYPLSFLSFSAASLIIQIISFILYVSLIYESLKFYKLSSYFFKVLPLSFLWYPFIAHLGLVQISIFLCYLLFKGYIFLEQKKIKTSAFLFSIASSIKLYPLYLFLYFFNLKSKRIFILNLISLFLISTITLYLIGYKDFFHYFLERISLNSYLSGEAPFNASLYSSLMYIFSNTIWSTPLIYFTNWKIIYYFFFILLSAPILLNFKLKISTYNLFPICILTMLLLTPILWSHMLLILIPVFCYLYKNLTIKNMNLFFLYIAMLFSSLPLMQITNHIIPMYPKGLVPWYFLFVLKIPLFSIIILLILCYRISYLDFMRLNQTAQ